MQFSGQNSEYSHTPEYQPSGKFSGKIAKLSGEFSGSPKFSEKSSKNSKCAENSEYSHSDSPDFSGKLSGYSMEYDTKYSGEVSDKLSAQNSENCSGKFSGSSGDEFSSQQQAAQGGRMARQPDHSQGLQTPGSRLPPGQSAFVNCSVKLESEPPVTVQGKEYGQLAKLNGKRSGQSASFKKPSYCRLPSKSTDNFEKRFYCQQAFSNGSSEGLSQVQQPRNPRKGNKYFGKSTNLVQRAWETPTVVPVKARPEIPTANQVPAANRAPTANQLPAARPRFLSSRLKTDPLSLSTTMESAWGSEELADRTAEQRSSTAGQLAILPPTAQVCPSDLESPPLHIFRPELRLYRVRHGLTA